MDDSSVRKNRLGGAIFALSVGITVAWFSFQWTTESEPRQAQRAAEESIVLAARPQLVEALLGAGIGPEASLQIADPLQTNRAAGKVFIYPADAGWEVSGHYRLGTGTLWRPWIMQLDEAGAMLSLSVQTEDGTLELP